jgi:signal transduction histidine kinase
MSELKLTIATIQTQGQAAAFDIVDTNAGITDMTTLKNLISTISNSQNKQTQAGAVAAKKRVQVLEYAAPLATIIDIFFIAAILYLSRRAITKEQQLDNLQEQFVAVASHQLRTPATIVKQYLNLTLNGTFGKLNKKQEEVLTIVNTSNGRGIKVANDLLSIAHIDNREVNISSELVDLCQLLTQVVSHYREALAKGKQQQLIVRMPKRAVMAKVDPFYISLIFENLIENASKYSDKHKKIYVTLKSKQGIITFSVKDQGDGINQSDVSLLFKKFSRLNEAVKKVEGSGLGLYLVKQAALLHGGDAVVDSTVGKGSTFIVTLKQEVQGDG